MVEKNALGMTMQINEEFINNLAKQMVSESIMATIGGGDKADDGARIRRTHDWFDMHMYNAHHTGAPVFCAGKGREMDLGRNSYSRDCVFHGNVLLYG